MNPYLDALNAMHDLLGALRERHWQNWITQDIQEWNNHQSVSHHLSAYGGMGSFNDIGFDDIWLNVLFGYLKSACYYFAHHPMEKPDTTALNNSMGSADFKLSGWRCLACGYGSVSRWNIDLFVAQKIIRQRIVSEAGHTRLREFVALVIRSHPTDETLTSANVSDWAKKSGLNIRESNEWLRPCPNCKSNDTAVYDWMLVNKHGYQFVALSNNLQLRSSAV